MHLFFPHTEEGASVSDGRFAEWQRVKGILYKGANSNVETEWARGNT